MWIVKFVLIVVVMSVVLLVAGLNAAQTVDLNLLFTEYQDVSVVLVILLSFICGMFVTLIISVFREMQLKTRIRQERKSCSKLEKELVSLRNLQLEETEEEKPEIKEVAPETEAEKTVPPPEAVDKPSDDEAGI